MRRAFDLAIRNVEIGDPGVAAHVEPLRPSSANGTEFLVRERGVPGVEAVDAEPEGLAQRPLEFLGRGLGQHGDRALEDRLRELAARRCRRQQLRQQRGVLGILERSAAHRRPHVVRGCEVIVGHQGTFDAVGGRSELRHDQRRVVLAEDAVELWNPQRRQRPLTLLVGHERSDHVVGSLQHILRGLDHLVHPCGRLHRRTPWVAGDRFDELLELRPQHDLLFDGLRGAQLDAHGDQLRPQVGCIVLDVGEVVLELADEAVVDVDPGGFAERGEHSVVEAGQLQDCHLVDLARRVFVEIETTNRQVGRMRLAGEHLGDVAAHGVGVFADVVVEAGHAVVEGAEPFVLQASHDVGDAVADRGEVVGVAGSQHRQHGVRLRANPNGRNCCTPGDMVDEPGAERLVAGVVEDGGAAGGEQFLQVAADHHVVEARPHRCAARPLLVERERLAGQLGGVGDAERPCESGDVAGVADVELVAEIEASLLGDDISLALLSGPSGFDGVGVVRRRSLGNEGEALAGCVGVEQLRELLAGACAIASLDADDDQRVDRVPVVLDIDGDRHATLQGVVVVDHPSHVLGRGNAEVGALAGTIAWIGTGVIRVLVDGFAPLAEHLDTLAPADRDEPLREVHRHRGKFDVGGLDVGPLQSAATSLRLGEPSQVAGAVDVELFDQPRPCRILPGLDLRLGVSGRVEVAGPVLAGDLDLRFGRCGELIGHADPVGVDADP